MQVKAGRAISAAGREAELLVDLRVAFDRFSV